MPKRGAVPKFLFPKDFLWGAATSAHQVEGGLHNQWTVWELENARALAAQASYQYGDLKNWDDIKDQATSPMNYVSGRAVNHYQLYEHDFDLLQSLNMNTYRFSIEWSRIQPEEGAWDEREVAHYRSVLLALRKRNIEPVVTLFHFTVPVWFADRGGFEKAQNIKYFVAFARRIIEELGPIVQYVITINEPEAYAAQSYLEGRWPPQGHSPFRMRRVMLNLAIAHNLVARQIHRMSDHYLVSVAKNSVYIYAGDDSWLSVMAARVAQFFQDDYFLRQVMHSCDFIGVNYYFSERLYGFRTHNPESRISDMGWDMEPKDIEHVLMRLHKKYKKPILITENGLADANDVNRQWWITQSIVAMQRAIAKGVKLIGYIHWSLLDNVELDKGFWPHFGLISVDRRTMKRTPRKSAIWFARIIKQIQEQE